MFGGALAPSSPLIIHHWHRGAFRASLSLPMPSLSFLCIVIVGVLGPGAHYPRLY